VKPLALLAAALLAVSCSSVAPTATPTLAPNPTTAPTPSLATSPSSAPSPTIAPLVDGPLPAEMAAALQAVLDDYIVEHHLAPSISAAVLVPGVGAWYGASGLAETAGEVAATPDTVYAVGSITKTFLAALILRLVEEGFLGLDDPAADNLGPVAGSKTNGATIRQLLGMRSGIDNYTDHFDQSLDTAYSIADLVDLVGPPHFAPGEEFEYSNTNYLLLGLIAEVVTGGPLGELLHEYLIDRFDLTRTYYGATDVAAEPLAHGYVTIDGALTDVYDGSGHLPFANATGAALGAGSMASTAADIGRWIYLLYGGQVLRHESQAELLDFSASIDYGLGTMRFVVPGGGQVVGHSGNIAGFMSAAYMARDSGTIAVILTNGETLDMSGALNRLFAAVR